MSVDAYVATQVQSAVYDETEACFFKFVLKEMDSVLAELCFCMFADLIDMSSVCLI